MNRTDIIRLMNEVAPQADSLADIGRKVNEQTGLGWSPSTWRGFWKDDQALRDGLNGMIRKAGLVRPELPREVFDVDRYIKLQIAAAEEWAKQNRLPSNIDVTIPTDSPIAVTFSSDWHVGGLGVAYARLRRDNERQSRHPRIYTLLGGDWGNNFVIDALRHAGESDIFRPGDQQRTVFRRELQVLNQTGSVIACGVGNHDKWTDNVAGIDPSYEWLGSLRPYTIEEGGTINLTVGETTYVIWRRHKPRRRNSDNPAWSVSWEYKNGDKDFDIGVLEHDHSPTFGWFHGHQRPDGSTRRLAVRTGTYKLKDSYATDHGYHFGEPTIVGVVLWPDRKRMLPVLGLDELEDVLDGLI